MNFEVMMLEDRVRKLEGQIEKLRETIDMVLSESRTLMPDGLTLEAENECCDVLEATKPTP